MRTTVVALLLITTSCKSSEPGKTPAPVATTSSTPATPSTAAAATTPAPRRGKDPETARKLIAAGVPVVDVRTEEEYAEDHVPSARNIPVDAVADRLADFEQLVGGDKSKPIVVYCESGSRSRKAKSILDAAGFTNVVNGGGLGDLQ